MIVETLLEIIKYALPGLVVCLTVYLMMKNHREKEEKLKLYELKSQSTKEALPIRLQAYERMALLLHRISPENMILRVQRPGMNAEQLRKVMNMTIKQEVEHNITQQIYLNPVVWNAVQTYKNDLINVINTKNLAMNDDSTALDLGKGILEHYAENPDVINPQRVMAVLNQDLKTLFI